MAGFVARTYSFAALWSHAKDGVVSVTVNLDERRGPSTVMACMLCSGIAATVMSKDFLKNELTEQFTAMGAFSDGTMQNLTQQVLWASSDPSVTISNEKGSKGLGTAAAQGETMISATLMGVLFAGHRRFGIDRGQ